MPFRFDRQEQLALAWTLAKWTFLGTWVGLLSGVASWLFLTALYWATGTREAHPELIYALPIAGAVISFAYQRFGKEVEGGNNLLLERIHDPKDVVPFRMAPLILLTTVATHLFGGSAGREGTAVQMGGTLGQLAAGPLRLSKEDRRILIMAGVSGGFGSVFGTPLAGAVFGLEVLSIGRIRYDGLIPCLAASLVGDLVCRGLGMHHHDYRSSVGEIPTFSAPLLGWVLLAGVLFAFASGLFSEMVRAVQFVARKASKLVWLRPVLGGLVIVALTLLVGNAKYNGLSLDLIQDSFVGKVALYAFLLKIVFTAITLGSGFKGGEVTPLFCIGATLGNAFAQVTHLPIGFFAAIGFAAVFAGAANTPLACTLMGIELFGAELAVPLAVACVTAYVLSGHRGIYSSQRVSLSKAIHVSVEPEASLKSVAESGVNVRRFQVPKWMQRH